VAIELVKKRTATTKAVVNVPARRAIEMIGLVRLVDGAGGVVDDHKVIALLPTMAAATTIPAMKAVAISVAAVVVVEDDGVEEIAIIITTAAVADETNAVEIQTTITTRKAVAEVGVVKNDIAIRLNSMMSS
jgi:hypothetical protein